MPRTPSARPGVLASPGQKLAAMLVLVLAGYLGLHWWQGRQAAGPDRPAMTPATVLRQGRMQHGLVDLTVRYTVGGTSRDLTKPVDAASFRAQGDVAWVCYRPGDATDASIRLPQDPLCDQH